MLKRIISLLLIFYAVICVSWSQGVEMTATSLFGGSLHDNALLNVDGAPILVSLNNKGKQTRGELSLSSGFGNQTRYVIPVDLPSGAKKEILISSTFINSHYQSFLKFQSPNQEIQINVILNQLEHYPRISGTITDYKGGLSVIGNLQDALRLNCPESADTEQKGQVPPGDPPPMPSKGPIALPDETTKFQPPFFIKPELASINSADYNSALALFIGPGAERLTPLQIQALKSYANMGGLLIITGGAAQQHLLAPELADLLPVKDLNAKSISSLPTLGDYTNSPAPDTAGMISAGTLKPGSSVWLQQDGAPLIVYRQMGFGGVLFLAFSPWEKPFSDWQYQRAFYHKLFITANPMLSADISDNLSSYLNDESRPRYGNDNRGDKSYPDSQDLLMKGFNFKLPATSQIIILLVVYFIIVVPVNFFVLKAFKKPDLYWITGPLFAVVFILIMLAMNSSLYKIGYRSNTLSVIVANSNDKSAYACSTSLMFFPVAGNYNLAFPDTERLQLGQTNNYNESLDLKAVNIIAGNPATVPGYSVKNLSFEKVSHTHYVDLGGTIDGDIKYNKTGDGFSLEGSIINNLPYEIKQLKLVYINTGAKQNKPSKSYPKIDETLTMGGKTNIKTAVYPNNNVYFTNLDFLDTPIASKFGDFNKGLGADTKFAVFSAVVENMASSPTLSTDVKKNNYNIIYFFVPLKTW